MYTFVYVSYINKYTYMYIVIFFWTNTFVYMHVYEKVNVHTNVFIYLYVYVFCPSYVPLLFVFCPASVPILSLVCPSHVLLVSILCPHVVNVLSIFCPSYVPRLSLLFSSTELLCVRCCYRICCLMIRYWIRTLLGKVWLENKEVSDVNALIVGCVRHFLQFMICYLIQQILCKPMAR